MDIRYHYFNALLQTNTLVIVCSKSDEASGSSVVTVQAPSKQLRLAATGEGIKLVPEVLAEPVKLVSV